MVVNSSHQGQKMSLSKGGKPHSNKFRMVPGPFICSKSSRNSALGPIVFAESVNCVFLRSGMAGISAEGTMVRH